MGTDLLNDYRWLVSEEGAIWLARLGGSSASLVARTKLLRKSLTASRAHLVLEQLELRRRATAKFEEADRLFFAAQALEQATDQWIAALKAQRFPQEKEIADLCCGIGGDLLGLARRGRVAAVDANPVHALLAAANCRAIGLASPSVQTADATSIALEQFAAWHIDPDRRVTGRRSTQLADSQPPLTAMDQMRRRQANGAVKLAPATVVPPHWASSAERQWIGSGRECRQQVVWFGELALHPGQHSAQVVHQGEADSSCLVGAPAARIPAANHLGPFICEPHAVVLAAQLTGALAAKYHLLAVDSRVAYLTSQQPIVDPLLSCFAVLDVFPFDMRKLRAALQARRIGHLEVKKRGVPLEPANIRRQLQGRGDESATLLITPLGDSVRAVLCQRVHDRSGLLA